MARAREITGLDPEVPFGVAAARVLRLRSEELWEHADGVLDTSDIERVHDMRVATRRLRAVLEIFEACFEPEAHAEVLRDVKALADALGERRDPDVQIAALIRYRDRAPDVDRPGIQGLIDSLAELQGGGNEALERALTEARHSDLRGRLDALAREEGG
jgi:CHAD domain-containing protein